MKSAQRFVLVLVTAPDVTVARRLAQKAVEEKLAACASFVPKLESIYWWKGKIERSAEVLILFKTPRRLLAQFEALILSNHPYDTPEILAVEFSKGTPKYLSWLAESVGQQ